MVIGMLKDFFTRPEMVTRDLRLSIKQSVAKSQ